MNKNKQSRPLHNTLLYFLLMRDKRREIGSPVILLTDKYDKSDYNTPSTFCGGRWVKKSHTIQSLQVGTKWVK